jgi:hypothetical protein
MSTYVHKFWRCYAILFSGLYDPSPKSAFLTDILAGAGNVKTNVNIWLKTEIFMGSSEIHEQLGVYQEAKYVESWPNTTSAWAGWSRFDIPVDRYDGVHSLLLCIRITPESSTCTRLANRKILIEQNIKKRTGPALCVLCGGYDWTDLRLYTSTKLKIANYWFYLLTPKKQHI